MPVAVAVVVIAVLIASVLWSRRRAHRSPRAEAAAAAARNAAGVALVNLDDAVSALDVELGLSGVLHGSEAAAPLRRARLAAHHARDDAFEAFRGLDAVTPAERRRRDAVALRTRAQSATAAAAAARTTHAEWLTDHGDPVAQVAAAQERLRDLRTELGDPAALTAELTTRYEPTQWRDAQAAAAAIAHSLEDADAYLRDAADRAADPTRAALPMLARAEQAMRTAREHGRRLDEAYRLVLDADRAVGEELAAAQAAVQRAWDAAGLLPPEASHVRAALAEVTADLQALADGAVRRPATTVTGLARLRERLDDVIAGADTPQQHQRGARSALPGALAAARAAIARAEPAASVGVADARVRLDEAQRDLAAARGTRDPVAALASARRAMHQAELALTLTR